MARKKREPDRPPGCQILAGYDPMRGAEAAGCWFDPAAGAKAAEFFPACLRHIEGSTASKPFILEPWQDNFIRMLFGWLRKDSMGRVVRRYREVLLYIPRKNGKTPLAAGIALYLFFCDGEVGAQVYCAAADTDQAALLFRHSKGMVDYEPELSSRAKIYAGAGHRSMVLVADPGASFRVLSSDANTKHGGNTHAVLVDELHAQKDRELVDVLETSMASATRKQPLMVNITTADYDRPSICNEKYDYATKVRDGVIDDPTFLPVVFELLLSDDWTNEKNWHKSNPNLGVSVSLDYMRQKCKKAQESPVYENTFKRLHLNIRTSQAVCLIKLEDWDKCPMTAPDLDDLAEEECFAALDLASTGDLAALVFYFPGRHLLLPMFFCPADNAADREKRDRVPYITWSRQGLITLTPGNVIDYEYIIAEVVRSKTSFRGLRQVAYDPWNARQTAIALQEKHGVEMVEFRQGFVSMNEPTKEFLKLIKSKKLNHGANPVLRWMASNASAKTDPADNIKIDKKTSKEKVDGLIASVMALGLSMIHQSEGGNSYSDDDAGVLVLEDD